MGPLHDFHGGIQPPDQKQQSTATPIRQTALPDRLVVPLQQHIGAPSQCLVSPGEQVAKGQLIAAAQGAFGVPIHAPTSGQVHEISPQPVPHPSGLLDWCVLIDPDGDERWTALEPCPDFRTLMPAQLLQRIQEAGIAGLGGAGFPTAIKLAPASATKIQTLILNGAECEPYISADQLLMEERAREIIAGLEIMAYILEPAECLIAVEDNKPAAIHALQQAVAGTTFEVVVIPTRYPSGGEKQLIEILTGRQVPHDGFPATIGVLCQNVATAAAVHRAIRYGEPLISRITTVTGEAVAAPGNYQVLIGTPIRHLLEQAGFNAHRAQRLIAGGAMMGFALDNLDCPITKTSNCLIAATAAEMPAPPPAQACIRCGMCEQVCPMQLLPQQLYWFARAGEHDKAEQLNLFDCIECGACAYVCPSSIPLVQYYRNAKGEIRQQQAEQLQADRARERFEARQTRLQQEQEAKEARRRERTLAAAQTASQHKAKSAAVQAALARAQAKKEAQAEKRSGSGSGSGSASDDSVESSSSRPPE